MPRTPKVHLAVTGVHRGLTFSRSLCDNGVGSDKRVADLAALTDEERGPYGDNVCRACLSRIPYLPFPTTPEN